jgi:2-hydroxy-3-oxopropionate reductase
MVTTGADVEAVALGEGGIVHGARPGTVLVDMGTIPPGTARRIAAKLAERGIETIDAPVSGGEVGAQNATLAIMAGGKSEVLERVRPLLEKLGKTLVHIGPNGAGQVAKACNQMIMVSCIEAVAEALLLAEKAGVDPARVRQALSGGSAASRVLEFFGTRMAARDFTAGVEARLHHKDFGILMNEAAALGAPLPIAAQVWQQLNALMAHGWGREDTSSLLRVLEGESRPDA